MQKKLLIAVDGSLQARSALIYAAGFLTRGRGLRGTLFHVQPIISQYLLDEARTNPKINESLKKAIDQNTVLSHDMLDGCKKLMVQEGVDPALIDTVSQTRMLGLTKDIIEHSRKNLFDAMVIGRRGLSRVQEVFMGSTSAKLVEHSGGIPVWVVDGQVRPRRFLIAVDNIESAKLIVDHLCFVCAGMTDLELTFFHVPQSIKDHEAMASLTASTEVDELIARSEKQLLDSFWPQAVKQLISAGLESDQLGLITPAKSAKIGKMIIEEAKNNNYDTIVLGRRGSNKAYYFGSVSRYVTERLSEHAIWIVG
jgi:nucleotide-binding universal stress UspA family protein